ncbi:MAG: hypothetical protein Q8P18_10185 [Pseudomonadota bacterium]|nr:hypothetical protein [Pseudomonadota bacterium]
MRRIVCLVGVVGMLFAAPVLAQTPGISGELEQSSTTSPKEKSVFTDAALAEIEGSVNTVQALLTAAEKEKNVEEIECLTRKLTPLRALLEVSRQAGNTMKLSLAANDTVHADQEFRKVAVALTKAREFLAEAQACTGDAGVERGDASSTVTDNGENSIDSDADIPEIQVPLDGPDSTPN